MRPKPSEPMALPAMVIEVISSATVADIEEVTGDLLLVDYISISRHSLPVTGARLEKMSAASLQQ